MFQSEGGLHSDMPQGKRGIADSAYRGLKECITVHREGHSKEMTNFINRVCAHHENFYARLKKLSILSDTFCGSWNKCKSHKMLFEVIVILVQYDMENGHPLMKNMIS